MNRIVKDGLELAGVWDILTPKMGRPRVVNWDFRSESILNGNARGAVFSRCDLSGVKVADGADWRGTRIVGSDLRDADLGGANLRHAEIVGCRIDGCKLPNDSTIRIRWCSPNTIQKSVAQARKTPENNNGAEFTSHLNRPLSLAQEIGELALKLSVLLLAFGVVISKGCGA